LSVRDGRFDCAIQIGHGFVQLGHGGDGPSALGGFAAQIGVLSFELFDAQREIPYPLHQPTNVLAHIRHLHLREGGGCKGCPDNGAAKEYTGQHGRQLAETFSKNK
jgi:hypothetical protein